MTNINYFNSQDECINFLTDWLSSMALNADVQECTDPTTGETKFAVNLNDFCRMLQQNNPKLFTPRTRKSGLKYHSKTSDLDLQVREMMNRGMKRKDIAKSLNISVRTLYSIIKNNHLE